MATYPFKADDPQLNTPLPSSSLVSDLAFLCSDVYYHPAVYDPKRLPLSPPYYSEEWEQVQNI